MFSRRLLRIKVLQILYAFYTAEGKTYIQSEKDLIYSIQKSYELYHYLMLLLLDVVDYAESRIDLARQKKIPTQEDLNPSTKFVNNKFVVQLSENQQLRTFIEKKKLTWSPYPDIIKNLYLLISDTSSYKEYISSDNQSYSEDKKIVLQIFNDVFMNYEDLYVNLEEQNIFWLEDIDFIIQMVIKTLRKFKENQQNQLLPMLRDEEDIDFAKTLLRKSIMREEECKGLIQLSAKNWELDRIAFTDNLIMQMAITEVLEFQSIPIKVTMNEFIEISKIFSTRKSSQFINGILDHIISELKSGGRIVKKGRGLINN